MGVAAYNRGSLLISRQMCAEYGCHGCSSCTEYKPTPRPPDWGDKTRAKALKKARMLLRGFARRGKPVPLLADLADMVEFDSRFTRTTAEYAASEALTGAS